MKSNNKSYLKKIKCHPILKLTYKIINNSPPFLVNRDGVKQIKNKIKIKVKLKTKRKPSWKNHNKQNKIIIPNNKLSKTHWVS